MPSPTAGERTNTMDFIDKMLNNDMKENETNYKKMYEGNDFKIPEYDGFQQSVLKQPVVVG